MNACCISEYGIWYAVSFFCGYIPHCGRTISRIYRALLYGIHCHKFPTPTLPLQSPLHKCGASLRISRPDPSSVLLRQKLEIISSIEITFSSSSVQNKRRGGVSLLEDTVLHERRRHRLPNRHITASETKLDGYLSKVSSHLRRAVQLRLHYHTSTSSSSLS
jgi:hypothetical protein